MVMPSVLLVPLSMAREKLGALGAVVSRVKEVVPAVLRLPATST